MTERLTIHGKIEQLYKQRDIATSDDDKCDIDEQIAYFLSMERELDTYYDKPLSQEDELSLLCN
jgi:hypothetical protein